MKRSAAIPSFSSGACSLGGGNLTAALIRGKPGSAVGCLLRWIRSNSDTLSYCWVLGAVFVWRGVCLFCALAGSSFSESLLSFQAVETEAPANKASLIQGMCGVSRPGDLCSTSAKTTVPFASHSFHTEAEIVFVFL